MGWQEGQGGKRRVGEGWGGHRGGGGPLGATCRVHLGLVDGTSWDLKVAAEELAGRHPHGHAGRGRHGLGDWRGEGCLTVGGGGFCCGARAYWFDWLLETARLSAQVG